MMIRKFLAALILAALLPICAQAQSFSTWAGQNYVSPTPPDGDSTDRNATTAFVQSAFAGGSSPALAVNNVFVGNASNKAAAVPMSGDCTIVAAGIITCTKTNGVAFGAFATGTDAANLTGTLGSPHLPSPYTNGTISGNTSKFGTVSGSLTSNNCVKSDASGNLVDAGTVCNAAGTGQYELRYVSGAYVCYDNTGAVASTTGNILMGCNNAARTAGYNFRAVCPFGTSITSTGSENLLVGTARSVMIIGCTFVTSVAGNNGLVLDTANNGASLLWLGGSIVCSGSSGLACVRVYPHTASGGLYVFNPTQMVLPFIQTSNCTSGNASWGAVLELDSSFGTSISQVSAIYGMPQFTVGSLDGWDGTHLCAQFGMLSKTPADAFGAVAQNIYQLGYIQGFYNWAIGEGDAAVTAPATQALATNEYHYVIGSAGVVGHTATDGCVLMYGFLDILNGVCSINSGTIGIGIDFFNANSTKTWFVMPQNAATTPISDSSGGTTNKGIYNGTSYHLP